jgi:MFS family permease
MTPPARDLRHNFIVNVLDGGFFGLAIGFASFVTVIPLFVSTLTDSAVLIGLVPAIHNMGWQLPQLLTADRVARLSRYKPMVLLMTLNERLPFLPLAAVAWFGPQLGAGLTLALAFALLLWQGLGGGLTATAWQSMIAKIIPARRRGTFFGTQASAANLFASGSAVAAGLLLDRLDSPLDFSLCFLLAAVAMAISWGFIAATREPASEPVSRAADRAAFWRGVGTILRRDANFRWFLIARTAAQVALLGSAFYTVYAVRHYGLSEAEVGVMTAVLLVTQVAANPLMGWLADRIGHRAVLAAGALAATGSALLAWLAPDALWFYAVFVLVGVAWVAFWTIAIAMTLEFGTPAEQPSYIGLANTLIAPGSILILVLGGVLVNATSYPAAFALSALGGLVTVAVVVGLVRNPRDSVRGAGSR